MIEISYLSSEALRQSRDRLRAALFELDVAAVVITYSGNGDDGNVSEVTVKPTEALATLKDAQVQLRCMVGRRHPDGLRYTPEDRSVPLLEALREFTLTWVDEHHAGWENNDGGQGTVTIDVREDRFELEHSEFYTEHLDHAYSL